MPNVGPAEILVILMVALLVFGPNKLPEIGRQVGKAARELRRMQSSFRDEVRDVLEPPDERARPPKLTAAGSTASEDSSVTDAVVNDAARQHDEGGDEDDSPVSDDVSGDRRSHGGVEPGDTPSAPTDPDDAAAG